MFEKIGISKENFIKIITALVIAAIVLLTISVLSDNNDSRKQIIDGDGATEETLCNILSEIKGVGTVNAMVQYNENNEVNGVIVTAEGADDIVVRNNVTKGVATLFNIPTSKVMVFEKKEENQ